MPIQEDSHRQASLLLSAVAVELATSHDPHSGKFMSGAGTSVPHDVQTARHKSTVAAVKAATKSHEKLFGADGPMAHKTEISHSPGKTHVKSTIVDMKHRLEKGDNGRVEEHAGRDEHGRSSYTVHHDEHGHGDGSKGRSMYDVIGTKRRY